MSEIKTKELSEPLSHKTSHISLNGPTRENFVQNTHFELTMLASKGQRTNTHVLVARREKFRRPLQQVILVS